MLHASTLLATCFQNTNDFGMMIPSMYWESPAKLYGRTILVPYPYKHIRSVAITLGKGGTTMHGLV